MSISYQSSDSNIAALALRTQELVLTSYNSSVVSGYGTVTILIDLKQPVSTNPAELPLVQKVVNTTGLTVGATAVTISGNTVTATFAVAPIAGDPVGATPALKQGDVLIVKYAIK
jgi:hypothetical protein